MRRVAPIILAHIALLPSFPSAAAPTGPDLAALVRPLYEELQKPEFSESRCMLAPLFATDKRIIAMSRDNTFRQGDRILAINREPLNATSDRAVHDLLVRYPPNATMTVRVLRAESEVDITAPCSDSQQYYSLLRAAVTAAMQDDSAACADRMDEVGKLHALAFTWLNIALNCNVKAGRVSGPRMLAEYFMVFHEELLENDFSPNALQKVRPSLQEAAQKLLDAGSRPLAEKLQQEYAGEVAKWSPLQGSALGLQLQSRPPLSAQTGIVQEPPGVNVTQDGKVTQLTVAGQLASKHPLGCVPLEQVDNTRTPPDLYLGVSTCILKDDYRAAAALFALAGVASRFDAERVLDKSAGQAGQVLIMGTFNGLPDEKREKFGKTVNELAADPRALAHTCSAIRKIGYPTYYPEYMVLHGIHAFTAKAGDPTLEPYFNAPTTWNSLLLSYLNCHDAPIPLTSSPSPPTPPSSSPVQASDPARMRPGFYQVKTNVGILDGNQKNDGPMIIRLCFTQAMLDKANPLTGQSGDCMPRKVTHNGNQIRSEMSCIQDGTTMAGSSVETVNGNIRSVIADVTASGAGGSHTLHLDAEFTFLGADCGATYAPAAP